MNNDVDTVPQLAQFREYRLDLVVAGDVAGEDRRGVQRFGQGPDPFF